MVSLVHQSIPMASPPSLSSLARMSSSTLTLTPPPPWSLSSSESLLNTMPPPAGPLAAPRVLGPPNRSSKVLTGPDWEVVVVTPSSSSSESERSTLLLLESQELVTAAPESGLCLSISSHGFSSFFLDLGPGLYFGTAGGDDFFSTLALASYFLSWTSFIWR